MILRNYASHRQSLMKRLPDGLILLSGGVNVVRNHDVHYPFRQQSHFLWLTGVEEAGCHLLLDPRRGTETLFVPKIDANFRVWEGHVPGPNESRKLFGIRKVAYADELKDVLAKARQGHKRLYADAKAITFVETVAKDADGLQKLPEELEDALAELRAIKDNGEVAMLRRASVISGKAHIEVMRRAKAGMREYQVQAIFDSECLKAGAKHLGYPSIIAAGRNGAVLHYRRNTAVLRKGELLLIDAACEVGGYTADITRTFPIGARFTRRQRDLYEIVLEAQEQCIRGAVPGVISAELHVHAMRVIAEGLKSLKILKGDTENLVMGGAVRPFFPHGIGHMLGLDVHDCLGGKKRVLPNPTGVPVRFVARLEPGFVITVEPGIYFIEALLNDKELRSKQKGSIDFARAESFLPLGGVRVEDDILIREKAPLNLTDVPKTVKDVERACGF